MQTQITPISPELIAADKALRRAADKVKKQAEELGTPYVIYGDSNTGQFLNKPSQSKK